MSDEAERRARRWDALADAQDVAAAWCEARGYAHGFDGSRLRERAARERGARP